MLFVRFAKLVLAQQNNILAVCCLFASLIYVLFRWNYICLNIQTNRHISQTCEDLENHQAIGSFCTALCRTKSIKNINCLPNHPNFRDTFTAEFHQTTILFKNTLSIVPSVHWYENGIIKYPNEQDFIKTIKAVVKRSLNVTIPQKTAIGLTHLKHYSFAKRETEMDNLWTLLHDNEYLLSALYAEKDLFPSLLGTCGSFFAVDYLESLQQFHSPLLTASVDLEEWSRRLRMSILILEMLEELAKEFNDLFHLCNIKLEHLALTPTRNKVKFSDVSGIFSKQTIKAFLQEKQCTTDEDCVHYSCHSRCLKDGKCSGKVVNSNVQIICERIFLGWKYSNKLLLPGLLMTPHLPTELASSLRHCAHPHFEGPYPIISEEDVRKNLYNILVEVEQSITSDSFVF